MAASKKPRQPTPEELVTLQTQEELHPKEAELRELLAGDTVGWKFVAWVPSTDDKDSVFGWPQRIADAQSWHIPVSPAWGVIMDCLDILFDGTCNTFNPFGGRPYVEERELFAHLRKRHGLSEDNARALTLIELASILQQDCRDIESRDPLSPKRDDRIAGPEHESTRRYRPPKCDKCQSKMVVASTRHSTRKLTCTKCSYSATVFKSVDGK